MGDHDLFVHLMYTFEWPSQMYSESMEISLVIISPLFGNKEEKQLLFLLRKYFGEGNVFYCKWSLL